MFKTSKLRISAIALGAALALGSAAPLAYGQDTLRITSWGGAFQDAQRTAFFEPFTEATGIQIIEDTWQGQIGQIRAMVESGTITTDLFDANPNDVITACDEGIAEPIDKSFIDDPDDFLEGALTECGVGTDIWAHAWVWDGDKLPADEGPQSIVDVLDAEKFPGRRGMPRRIYGVAEQVLLADGVPVEELYEVLASPEGLDRVFAKLEPMKDDIVWWTANPQAMQLLADGEVDFVVLPSSHWYGAVTRETDPRNFVPMWDGQIYSYDMWVMPLGTPNKEAAMKFLEFIIQPQIMADFAVESSYAPARRSAMDLVPEDVRDKLATAHATNAIQIDRIWWADHMDAYTRRFETWLQQ